MVLMFYSINWIRIRTNLEAEIRICQMRILTSFLVPLQFKLDIERVQACTR